jgi:hypothetical protein
MTVELSGYEAVIDNRVYGALETEGVLNVLRLSRYIEPTEDEVVGYMQRKASAVQAVAGLILPGGSQGRGRNSMEGMLMALPPQVLRDLSSNAENCMDFVRQNTSARNPPEGQSSPGYMQVSFGLIPEKVIVGNEEDGSRDQSFWYDVALGNSRLRRAGYGELWNMRLLLSEGGLPSKEVVDFFVERGVYGSPDFKVSASGYNVQQVQSVVDIIYSGVTELEVLEDTSPQVLETASMHPLVALQMMLQQAAVRNAGGNGQMR